MTSQPEPSRTVPAPLLSAIERDLTPVRPLLPAGRRTIIVVALAAAAAAVFLAVFGFRTDFPELSRTLFAVALSLRLAAGAILLMIALREAVPSGAFPRSAAMAALLGGAALLLVLPLAVARIAGAPDIPFTMAQLVCYRSELLIAAPALLVSYWLLARGYPVRPLFAAVTAGIGVGLLADAALFAHCPIDAPTHVLIAHEGAVLTVGVAGGFLGWLLQRRRLRSFLFAPRQ